MGSVLTAWSQLQILLRSIKNKFKKKKKKDSWRGKKNREMNLGKEKKKAKAALSAKYLHIDR